MGLGYWGYWGEAVALMDGSDTSAAVSLGIFVQMKANMMNSWLPHFALKFVNKCIFYFAALLRVFVYVLERMTGRYVSSIAM